MKTLRVIGLGAVGTVMGGCLGAFGGAFFAVVSSVCCEFVVTTWKHGFSAAVSAGLQWPDASFLLIMAVTYSATLAVAIGLTESVSEALSELRAVKLDMWKNIRWYVSRISAVMVGFLTGLPLWYVHFHDRIDDDFTHLVVAAMLALANSVLAAQATGGGDHFPWHDLQIR